MDHSDLQPRDSLAALVGDRDHSGRGERAGSVRLGVFPERVAVAAVPVSAVRRFLRNLLVGAGAIILLHLFVVQVSVVRGHSMRPSLRDGDRLVVDRLAYCVTAVDRFDVIVLRYPADPKVDFVKRVVGLPGDRVRVRKGVLFVNDVKVTESFTHVIDGNDVPERVVPPAHYFVLGDNRPISCDSRDFGVVAHEFVKGKVRACFWPPHRLSMF